MVLALLLLAGSIPMRGSPPDSTGPGIRHLRKTGKDDPFAARAPPEEMEPRLETGFETPPEGVRFDGCTFSHAEVPRAERSRQPISQINAGW